MNTMYKSITGKFIARNIDNPHLIIDKNYQFGSWTHGQAWLDFREKSQIVKVDKFIMIND